MSIENNEQIERVEQPVASADSTADIAQEKAKSDAAIPQDQMELFKTKAAKADEYYDRLLRQTAEFDNYKKRMARERIEAVQYANQSLLLKLINVMDHFDMALAAANQVQQDASLQSFKTGIDMIYSQLKSSLTDSGLEEINTQNQPFNPSWHEAISQKETTDIPEGQIVEQLRKGYKLNNRLLRAASVVVAKKPSA